MNVTGKVFNYASPAKYPILKIQTNIRPQRVTYFIPENDLRAYSEVAAHVCTQWGGMQNLIIPCGINGEIRALFLEFLRAGNPDFCVSHLPPSENSSLNEALANLFPHRSFKIHDTRYFEHADKGLHPLSLRESKVEVNPPKSILTNFNFEGDDVAQAISLTCFGKIFSGQEASYRKEFEIQNSSISSNSRRAPSSGGF